MVDLNKADTDAIEAMYFAYRAFTAEPDRLLAERSLGRAHHRIVYFIGRQPGITVGTLLETLHISKQALAAPLKRLHQEGLVRYQSDPSDKRIRQLFLTPEGLSLEGELSNAQSAMLQRAFDQVGPKAASAWLKTTRALAAQDAG